MIEHVHIVAEGVLRCNEGDYLSRLTYRSFGSKATEKQAFSYPELMNPKDGYATSE
jgi:hypothetical protein